MSVPELLLEYSHPDPYMNYSVDEVVQKAVGTGELPACIRIWEPVRATVYIGLGQEIDREVNLAACGEDGIPIIRRHSGGGAVFSADGILNVSLFIPLQGHDSLRNITGSYRILSGFLQDILKQSGISVLLTGGLDLTVKGRKVCGQAQSRKYGCLLHQASLVFSMDFDLLDRYLPMPSRMPEYRRNRPHAGFVAEMGRENREHFINAVRERGCTRFTELPDCLKHEAEAAAARYRSQDWTFKR